jgi:hypothetical protein
MRKTARMTMRKTARKTTRKTIVAMLTVSLVAGGAVARAAEPHPAREFGYVLGQIVVSPIVMFVGLLEGIASLPYLLEGDIHAMNSAMRASGSRVSLDQTYQYAYHSELASVPKSGDTGRVFRHLGEATQHFQSVLRGYGVEDAGRYVITAIRTADREGYTLYALVYRPTREIRVHDAYGRLRILSPRDHGDYYRPFETDADGAPLDVVIDWAGVPRTAIATQKGQAILMTLAANSVLINRRSNDYWTAERRWIGGDHVAVVRERKAYLDQRIRDQAAGVGYAERRAPVRPRAEYRYTFDARPEGGYAFDARPGSEYRYRPNAWPQANIAQAYGDDYRRPRYRRPRYRRQPYCREVGGYEAFMRQTGQVCRLD